MMETLFGSEHNVTVLQQCARALLVFAYGFLILRVSGRRTFAKRSAFDIIVSVMVGSALARVITGDANIEGTFAAVAVLVVLHLAVSWLVAHSERLAHLFEGRTVVLARGDSIDEQARTRNLISREDMCVALREAGFEGLADLGKTRRLHLEPGGKFSVVKREPS